MTVHTLPIETARFPSAVLSTSPRQQVPPNTPVSPLTGNAAGSESPNPSAPNNTPVITAQLAASSPLAKEHRLGGAGVEGDDIDIEDNELPPNATDLLPHQYTLMKYLNFKSFVSLVITPFFQGMFYGFGEGAAKVVIGRWYGVDPIIALGGGPQPEKRRRKPFSIANFFGRNRDASASSRGTSSEIGSTVDIINDVVAKPSRLSEGFVEGTDPGLKWFSNSMDEQRSRTGFGRRDDR
ncbi:hypothetical protein PhCBS80983_g04826 [Powellomyces hirtus]|uniref:Uncharacterized protein n=1 Tax=Powellomyces hirtus TaxID=109895 RepID=A0A507DYY1_9FUNG|nr:hypothetical protein PhCBS80983_g04826 [Powellomyces hirtus]